MNKKIIMGTVTCLAMIIFAGCDQPEVSTQTTSQKNAKAKGYVENLSAINQQSKEKIADAVDQQNQKNEEALEILEDDDLGTVNYSQISSMDTIPEEINMDHAQTCTEAKIVTNKGDIVVKFYNTNAPVTVANFCTLADKGFYDGVIFHRVIKDFMIQGGDPDGTGMGGPGYTFTDEIHAKNHNTTGTIAMANAGPGTNGSQFFINTKDNNFLDTKHTVFGTVEEGMDVVATIEEVDTDASDRPREDIVIESVTIR
jgi:peptidylprolyl isomerase